MRKDISESASRKIDLRSARSKEFFRSRPVVKAFSEVRDERGVLCGLRRESVPSGFFHVVGRLFVYSLLVIWTSRLFTR